MWYGWCVHLKVEPFIILLFNLLNFLSLSKNDIRINFYKLKTKKGNRICFPFELLSQK